MLVSDIYYCHLILLAKSSHKKSLNSSTGGINSASWWVELQSHISRARTQGKKYLGHFCNQYTKMLFASHGVITKDSIWKICFHVDLTLALSLLWHHSFRGCLLSIGQAFWAAGQWRFWLTEGRVVVWGVQKLLIQCSVRLCFYTTLSYRRREFYSLVAEICNKYNIQV